MIVSMKRLTLVGIRQEETDILRALQKIGAVELISVTADDDGGEGAKRLDEAAERISRFSESLSAIKPYAKQPGFLTPARQEKLEKMQQDVGEAEAASEHIRAILEEKKQIEARLEKGKTTYAALLPWADMDQEMSSIVPTKYTHYFIGLVDAAGETAIREQEAISAEFYGEPGNRAAILACLKEDARLVAGFLKTLNWTDVVFPHMKGTPKEAMMALEQDQIAGEKRLSELQTELESCGISASVLENAADALLIERDGLVAETQVEKDVSVFRLEGWVRSDEVDKVEEAIRSVTQDYYTEYRDPAEDEVPPTVLKNDTFNTPFESLITLYSLPDARGIDATPYMTPFYIFLFGIMLSDTGYGLVLSLGTWLYLKLKKPTGGTKSLAMVLFWGGISTMVWGVLVGTFFGLDFDALLGTTDKFPLLIDPTGNPVGMLLFCLLLGVIHLICGHLIKMKMCFGDKDWQGAIFDNLSWVLVLAGLVLAALPMASTFFDPPFELGWYNALYLDKVGLGLILLGSVLVLLFKGRDKKNPISRLASGLGGLYGVTSYLSDILSYARLLALGIATGYLAMVFNTLCSMLMGGSGVMKFVGFIIAVVLLVILHVFSIAINTLGTFVHCARLQYVEFFGKFYEEGGRAFKPLQYKTKHVQISK